MQDISMGVWGLFISAFISSTIAPGGSEAVLVYMVAEQQNDTLFLVGIATIGNTLGALTTWWLGSFTAKKYPVESLLPERKKQALHTVQKWGSWALLFSWLPVIGDGLCFAAGWMKLPLLVSLLAIVFGKMGRYAALAYFVDVIN